MALFAAVIFLGAFLLFQVEPLICKHLLPWFGGVPAVWSTCLVFFQTTLLAGYAYAHATTRWLSPRRQAALHAVLLGLSVAAMAALSFVWSSPITPGAGWRPPDSSAPVARILFTLAVAVGAPFFLLSTTGPLVQSWSARRSGGAPYRLYALSNFGSLLALLGYPFLVEPSLSLGSQGRAWSVLYVIFAAACAFAAFSAARGAEPTPAAEAGERVRVPLARAVLWVALSAGASVLLLATTTQMSQDVAAIPLLWVLPLALYLVSLILAFEREGWYHRAVWLPIFAASLALVSSVLLGNPALGALRIRLAIYSVALLCGCMIFHGELFRLRPPPRALTFFYLLVSLGGALGGLFVGLVAPHIFDDYWEFPLALGGGALVALIVLVGAPGARARLRLPRLLGATGFAVLATLVFLAVRAQSHRAIAATRNFFGVLRLQEYYPTDPEEHLYALVNGPIVHGYEFTAPDKRHKPTAEFTPESGVGLALRELHLRRPGGLHVGILGEGVGATAALAVPGDRFRFYEINPAVIRYAWGDGGYFHFLEDLPLRPVVVEGDARLALERELARGERQSFDLLAVDVFTGDAIPVHLLTEEAVRTYLAQLRPGGVLAFHISNQYLSLAQVVLALGDRFGLASFDLTSRDDPPRAFSSHWILLSSEPGLFQSESFTKAKGRIGHTDRRVLWTDDRSDIFRVLKRGL